MKPKAVLIGAVIFAALAAKAQYVGPSGPFEGFKSADKTPVEIKADRFEADLSKNLLTFKGHVSAKQGKRVIYADQMEVSYAEDGKVKVLDAKGNVKINMGDSFATADRMILDNTKELIHLIGNPRLVQGGQIIVGEKMVYEISKEKLTVDQPRIEWRETRVESKPAGKDAAEKKPETP